MAPDDDLHHRLDDLERRVGALEARPSTPGDPAPETELWALEGLSGRVPAPGAVMLVGDVRLPDGRVAQWQEGALTGDLVDGDWETASDVLSALGHPVRLRLLREVLRGAATAQELTAVEGVGTSGQVYHHLRQLVAAGWLRPLGGGRHEVPVARVVPLLAVLLGARR